MIPYYTSILDYDTARYPFARLAETFLGRDLVGLRDDTIGRLQVGKERTDFHRRLYDIGAPFLSLYRSFLKEVVFVQTDPALYFYQAIPSWRVHLPGNVATGNFHRDADFNHAIEEINFLVPLTPMASTSSVWIESEPGANDCAPVTMEPGQYLRFHGAALLHGSHPNTTGCSRVSFDFRVLPRTAYKDTGARTVNAGMDLRLGDYWADGGEL